MLVAMVGLRRKSVHPNRPLPSHLMITPASSTDPTLVATFASAEAIT